ncbi:MAG: ABC transporter permease [Thermodesulfobacteriota bacterium]
MTSLHFLRRFPLLAIAHRQTLQLMIERDFRTRYVQSIGGMLWAFANPLLLVLVYTLIFSLVFRREAGEAPFALWLFAGLLPWLFFSEVLKNAVTVIEKNKNLVVKTPFQPELLSLVVIGAALVGHAAGVAILLLLLLATGHPPGIGILVLPFYTMALVAFSLGLSWIISSLYLFVRDIGQVVQLLLQLWFYLCPIVYPASIIPEKYRFLYSLNPMYFIIRGYRQALVEANNIVGGDVLLFLGWTGAALLIGAFVFGRLKNQFVEML